MTDNSQIESSSLSHPGLKRSGNEDFITFFEPSSPEELRLSGYLYIVADGVGGAAEGERASRYAAEKVKFDYYQNPGKEPAERLKQAMQQANADIFTYSQTGGRFQRMATTLVAAVIREGLLTIAWVGDSRAYLFRGGQPWQITTDHNTVGEMVKNKLMSEEQALNSTAKNRLTRSLGGDEDVYVDVLANIPLQAGDKLLLCSDGLTRYATGAKIAELVGSGSADEGACRLIDFANNKGGADNVSVILVHIKSLAAPTVSLEGQARGESPYAVNLELMETQGPRPPTRVSTSAAASKPGVRARRASRRRNWWELPPLSSLPPDVARFGMIGFAGLALVFCLFLSALLLGKLLIPPQVADTTPANPTTVALIVKATVSQEVSQRTEGNKSSPLPTTAVPPTITPSPVLPSPSPIVATTIPPTAIPLPATTQPQPSANSICVAEITSEKWTLSSVLNKNPDRGSYDYYSFCNNVQDGFICTTLGKIKGPDYFVSKGQWVVIPDITDKAACDQYEGKWASAQ
jgi:serine/threonine protein phosphatase PrpC